MAIALSILFIAGFAIIILEHPFKLDKSVPALFTGGLMWTVLAFFSAQLPGGREHFDAEILHHTGKIAELILFLLSAMTIVKLIDLHKGFDLIGNWIRTKKRSRLLWNLALLAFILSPLIDSLTAAIVVVTINQKIVSEEAIREEPNLHLLYAGVIIIAANAGGAWSPIGAVTTTMLWIANKVSAVKVAVALVIPSVLCAAVPVYILSKRKEMAGSLELMEPSAGDFMAQKELRSKLMLVVAGIAFLSVPVLKTILHLPPYIGMMLALAAVWLVSERVHPSETFEDGQEGKKGMMTGKKALSRVEMSSVLFFAGVLFAVAALEFTGVLTSMAGFFNTWIGDFSATAFLMGLISAVMDNVPLTAAMIGMYQEPYDAYLWHVLAYCVATGGSILVIGSAAGVAVMEMEEISFGWYFKNITFLAAIGYIAGFAAVCAIGWILF